MGVRDDGRNIAPERKSQRISIPDSTSLALGPVPVRMGSLDLVTQGQKACCTTLPRSH